MKAYILMHNSAKQKPTFVHLFIPTSHYEAHFIDTGFVIDRRDATAVASDHGYPDGKLYFGLLDINRF